MTTPTSDLVAKLYALANEVREEIYDLADRSREIEDNGGFDSRGLIEELEEQADPLRRQLSALHEAAARLTELEAEVSRLREREKVMVEALRPFAEVAKKDIGDDEANADTFKPFTNPRLACAALLTVGDLRRAAAAMEP